MRKRRGADRGRSSVPCEPLAWHSVHPPAWGLAARPLTKTATSGNPVATQRQHISNAALPRPTLKPRGERLPMKQMVEGRRKKLREVAGISVFMRPVQNLQLGGRQSMA